jgi:flagellin
MSDTVLSAGVRQNLLSLQNTAGLMATTQNRLATGKKVNTALDNPTNFFTSASLNSRAGDLSALLDSMSNGIKTLQAADNGVTALTKTIEQMQATLHQARQDKSFNSASYTLDPAATGNLSFSGGAIGATAVNIPLMTGTPPLVTANSAFSPVDMTTGNEVYAIMVRVTGAASTIVDLRTGNNTDGGTTLTLAESIAGINADLAAANSDVRARESLTAPGRLEFFINSGSHTGSGQSIIIGPFGATGTTPSPTTFFGFGAGATDAGEDLVPTVDGLVAAINGNAGLTNKVRASNDNGKLRIENLSAAELSLAGVSGIDGEIDGSAGASNTATIGPNNVRRNLVKQFNELRDQLNKLADDASFNGVNLLRGDKLKITFNEAGTSTIEIQAKDANGNTIAINTSTLGILEATDLEFDSDTTIDTRLTILGGALGMLRAQGSAFGSNLSIVQNRQDFTKAMINTLTTGADNLVLADSNEEGVNMLALQTRQQLSTTALSLSAQADQAVLRLFG